MDRWSVTISYLFIDGRHDTIEDQIDSFTELQALLDADADRDWVVAVELLPIPNRKGDLDDSIPSEEMDDTLPMDL